MPKTHFNPSAFFGDEKVVRRFQQKYAGMFRAGQKVLDLGCGTGTFLTLLKERGIDGTGVDVFEPCVRACRERGLAAHQSDILTYLKKTRERFDGVFCSHVIEHLAPEKAFLLLEGMQKVLLPGGTLIIITPNSKDIEVITERFWLDVTHVRPYPLALLSAMVSAAGFSVADSGLDTDTRQRLIKRNPFRTFEFLLKKLRFGEYFANGDTFLVARKKESQT